MTETLRVERLMRRYATGDRVRAVETLVYASGEVVVEGTVGRVQQVGVHGCTPLVTVAWDDRGEGRPQPHITEPCSTENLEPFPLDPG